VVSAAGLVARRLLQAGPAGHPLVGRQAGQRLARAELSKAMYHPSPPLLERILNAIARFLDRAQGAMPGGGWTLVALVALVVIVAAGVLAWVGPVARARSRGPDPLLASARRSARDHRQRAERLAAEGDFAGAIIEIVRAIAVDLEERDVVPPRVGRTAAEFAAEAGRALPDQAADLDAAARLFDDVRYGDRPGTAGGFQRLRDLDAAMRAARPDVTATPAWVVATGAAAGAAAGPVT
jgi:hypothetical protein